MPALLPNSSGLAEANPCHNPPGPGGGRFCSKTGGIPAAHEFEGTRFRGEQQTVALKTKGRLPVPPPEFFAAMGVNAVQRAALMETRARLMEESFGVAGNKANPVETLAAVSLVTGQRLDGVSQGDGHSVAVNAETRDLVVNSSEEVFTMHTHPSSSPPSVQDINHLLNSPERVVMTAMAARDGSVFGVSVDSAVKNDYYDRSYVLSRFLDAHTAANKRAMDLITVYLSRRLGLVTDDTFALRDAAIAKGLNPDRMMEGIKWRLTDAAYKRVVKHLQKKFGPKSVMYVSWFSPEAVAWQNHMKAEIGQR